MSEPIIIETPAPPTRERLVLVPLHSVSREANDPSTEPFTVHTNDARDATPADLERAGYVMREPGDYYSQWAAERDRARKAESDLAEVRELQRSDERDGNVGFSLTCWVESILEQLNVARINRTELGKAAGQYARERDEQRDRAARAERERDEALGRAQSETEWRVRAVSERQDAEAERDTLRAELARLTAPGEGSEGEMTLAVKAYSGHGDHETSLLRVYRLGVAHERARQQPEKDRATDEDPWDEGELAEVFMGAWGAPCDLQAAAVEGVRLRRGVAAVAARVRQGRCLIAQAVPCVTCHGHGRIYQPDDALNDDDGATCRACGGTGHERTDAEWLDQAMTVGLAQCDALRRTVAKLTERCEQWEGERNAIAFVLSTTAERRGDYGSLGYATLARLLGEVARG